MDSSEVAGAALSTVGAMLRRSLIAALSLAAIVLTGCTDTTRIPPADPTPTDAPLFSSDEEALAAATEVYEEFLFLAASVLQDGGDNPERLRPLVSDEVWETEQAGFSQAQDQGLRLVGQNELLGGELQQVFTTESGTEVVSYFCVSNADTDVIASDGSSISDPDRRTELTFEVVTLHTAESGLIVRNDPWEGGSICES